MRPAWQSHNRLDEDEVIIRHPDSDTTAKFLSAEEPIADQEMENESSEFEVQPDANEEHAKEDAEKQNEESTAEREVQNLSIAPVTSLEESNQDDSVNPEVVLAPREPIREEIKDTEPAPPPIADDAVTAEEPIRDSSKESESCESVGHSVVNNELVSDLPVSNSNAVSEELKDKPEVMETSGENS